MFIPLSNVEVVVSQVKRDCSTTRNKTHWNDQGTRQNIYFKNFLHNKKPQRD